MGVEVTGVEPTGVKATGIEPTGIEPTVTGQIDRLAAVKGASAFLVDPRTGAQTDWSELAAFSRNLCGFLASKGLQPGATVAFAFSNSPNAAKHILGLMYGGYLATAVNLVSGTKTVSYVLAHSKSAMVLVDDSAQDLITAAVGTLASKPAVQHIDAIPACLGDPGATLGQKTEASSDALLMYTSGTTGTPKGVVLTHAAVLSGGQNTVLAHGLTPADRAMCVLPLYHINGLCVTLMAPLVSGGSVAIPPKFSVSVFWEQLAASGCTWFSVVPTQISYLLHDDGAYKPVPGLRFGRSASAPLSPDVQRAFEEKFGIPVIETMGLTETAAQILSNPLPPGVRKIGSPGVAFGNRVIIADTAQNELPRGQEGELLVKGANLMRVYLDNPEATGATLTKDGWLRTGDLGRMDDDGYVFVTGRLKELIIKGGENIAPREIDDVLYSNPNVIEAGAFSVACRQYGERVEAAVVVKDAAGTDEADLIALCVGALGKFKAPDRIHFVDEMPKGPSGKIQRLKIASLVQDRIKRNGSK